MTSATAAYHVLFMEEPLIGPAGAAASLGSRRTAEGVQVVTPLLPAGLDAVQSDAAQRLLLDRLLAKLRLHVSVAWYYTPMALDFAGHLAPDVTVFDSMDELSAFRGASPRLLLLERRLLRQADLVFTGGHSLHEAKRARHPRVALFPSSVDSSHYAKARGRDRSPPDQAILPRPRIGYFGVIDERMNLELVDGIARQRPDWQLVMVGPVAKLDPDSLPKRANLHWLGMKSYAELPSYVSGWDAGLMPFALNDATQFISPTKTPEYLAAGVPVVSTPVVDVVHDWGSDGLVAIAADVPSAVVKLEAAMALPRASWLAKVDQRLLQTSWDATWNSMQLLISGTDTGAAETGEVGNV